MTDLAVVMVTCEKYSFLWEAWHHYYKKNFKHNLPEYFISDSVARPFDGFNYLKYETTGVNGWSGAVRGCIEKIPHKNIFFLLDDLMFTEDISDLFQVLYAAFTSYEMDSLRIIMKPSAATAEPTEIILRNRPVRKLAGNSKYLVSYVPNIFKKDVLLDFLKVNESPWNSEVKGTKRIKGKGYSIYDYSLPDWYINSVVLGRLTAAGLLMLEKSVNI